MVYVLAATLYEAVIGHITATNKKGDRHNCVALNMHVLINVGDNRSGNQDWTNLISRQHCAPDTEQRKLNIKHITEN